MDLALEGNDHVAREAGELAGAGHRPVEVGGELLDRAAEGAAGNFLGSVLERLCMASERPREDFLRALSRSYLASVDGAHAVHPSHVDRHEPQHRPHLNGGPVIKINAMERYATTLHTDAHLAACADRAGVPLQRYIHRTDLPCGSTIGPISATQLGIATVD
ncbi:M18 family aminopeptidase, partial [bacterium]|nr:M18 family aminopeptidase [bacterium]